MLINTVIEVFYEREGKNENMTKNVLFEMNNI